MWKATQEGVILSVKITPNSKKNHIVGWENEKLKIRICQPPEKGLANEELVRFIAKELNIPKARIVIVHGETSRHKRLLIKDLEPKNIWFLSKGD